MSIGLGESSSQSIQWYTYEQGMTLAKELNKPTMIDFTAKWCSWCDKLDKYTYSDEKLINLSDKFICIKVDTDGDGPIANKFRINGIPTIIFTDPEGNEINRIVGYIDSNNLIKEMNLITADMNTLPNKNDTTETPKETSKAEETPGFTAFLTFSGLILALYLFLFID